MKLDNKFLIRSIFLKFNSDSAGNYKILLLHDSGTFSPIFRKIKNKFNDDCITSNTEDFVEELKSNENEYSLSSFICLLVLSPGITSAKRIQEIIAELAKKYTLQKIEIDFDKSIEEDFYNVSGNEEEIVEELKYMIGIELLDDSLPNEMSNLMKKLFKDNKCSTLNYKILSGGFSGSTVLEVMAFTDLGKSDRFVVKIGEKILKSIKEELDNYRWNVQLHDMKNYPLISVESGRYLAILYSYASGDSNKESEPFSRIYYRIDENKLLDVIKKLFSIKLFNIWNSASNRESKNSKIFDLYVEYLKKDELFKNIKKIGGGNKKEFINKIEKIFDEKIDATIKVCHGDLHTDNFFYDGEKVFLIDFGHTGKCHSLIDHTTLECAIKFRLIPFYVPIEDLKVIEEELLSIDSFNTNYSFKNIPRGDLIKPFRIINQIRSLSTSLFINKNDPLEYLISLLMITLRQIQYKDVNQLYALNSAEILVHEIIVKLKL